ncbi:anti-sigma-D factor RsdA [Nocardia sp. NPDC050710]|uniref:anti-sigma-D factor RsdA n=1 Tax=Nocardia sp. NPDC050710 TaxID=3157220 RepID=UPI00340935A7
MDIAAVRRDDALIDAISSAGPVQTDSAEEFQLAALLADWRAELVEPPLPTAPDLDAVVAAVNQEIGARKVRVGAQTNGRLRLVRPILGTAAALALVIGGLTAFSYNAEPGGPLWRVKEVVFSEQAQTTVVNRAGNQMDQAKQALAQGSPTLAKEQLEAAQANVTQVSDQAKRTQLQIEWEQLLAELRKNSPELANQVEAITKPTEVRPTAGSGSTTTSKPSQPAGQTTPNNTILQAPVDSSATTLPTTQEPTAPTKPGTTTAPPVTQEPTNPTTQEPPTQTSPSTVGSSPGTGNGTGTGTGGVELPTPPTNQVPTQNNPGGITIPTLPFTLPGQPR